MKVLGVDLGSEGAAVGLDPEGNVIDTWLWHLKGDRVKRAYTWGPIIGEIILNWLPDIVMFERPFCRGIHATRSLWGQAGILEEKAGAYSALLDATPSEIKEFATGSGTADKQAMIDAAAKRGYHAQTEHAADAYHAALYALHHHTTGD